MDFFLFYLNKLILQDYLFILIILLFGVLFGFLRSNYAFKFYYGVLTGFVLFLIFNLGINNLNDNDLGILNFFRDGLVNLKVIIFYISFYSIFFLPIFFISDYSLNFKRISNKILDFLTSFLLGLFFPIFLLSIVISVVDNRLIFGINTEFLSLLHDSYIIGILFNSGFNGIFFTFINEYSYIICFLTIFYLLYKITFSGFFRGLFGYFYNSILVKKTDNKKEESSSDDS